MERCRTLIQQNTKKHHDIWLKGDAVVRVPHALRPVSLQEDERRKGKGSRSMASQGSHDMQDLIGDLEEKDAPNQGEVVINNAQTHLT